MVSKKSGLTGLHAKVKNIGVLEEKLRSLQRKRMKWGFINLVGRSLSKKYEDYPAKLSVLEQTITRLNSKRITAALRTLELFAIHKKNKTLAITHILLKLMILKDTQENMLKEYAFDMIRLDGEEMYAKISNKNYGHTNGLYKLHYLILALEGNIRFQCLLNFKSIFVFNKGVEFRN
jgi:hypothetical protein